MYVRYLSAGSDREAIKLYRSRCQNEIVVLPDMPTLAAAVVAAGRYGRNFIFKPHNDRYRYNRYADDVRSADLPIFKPHPALHSLFFFCTAPYICPRVHAREIPYKCKCAHYTYVLDST